MRNRIQRGHVPEFAVEIMIKPGSQEAWFSVLSLLIPTASGNIWQVPQHCIQKAGSRLRPPRALSATLPSANQLPALCWDSTGSEIIRPNLPRGPDVLVTATKEARPNHPFCGNCPSHCMQPHAKRVEMLLVSLNAEPQAFSIDYFLL